MFNGRLIYFLLFSGSFAALGNYSYFYMEARLKELTGYRPAFLKYPHDLWQVYVRYRKLTKQGESPMWPSTAFALSFIAIVLAILYLVLMPKPFG